jgi:hypothetical protein
MTPLLQPDRHTFSDLLTELEASLRVSQAALLSRNLPDLEQYTSEQIELHRNLSQILSGGAALKSNPSAVPQRILYLTRVHLALLDRARQSLRMLANATAAHATYAPRPGTATVELSASGED